MISDLRTPQGFIQANAPSGAFAAAGSMVAQEVSVEAAVQVAKFGKRFHAACRTQHVLLMLGDFLGEESVEVGDATENQVLRACEKNFGFPKDPPVHTIAVLLDSSGGSLDSAFKTMRYLSRYATKIRVFIPRRAKSASTLLALGAHELFMSPFGELGPLDTQIVDPRNPADTVSALDCYQAVDYVSVFGQRSMRDTLWQLLEQTRARIPLTQLIEVATEYAQKTTGPMLSQVNTLDFGSWGRSLRIGEMYAQSLLRNNRGVTATPDAIAQTLVYGYTHHFFPIDYSEAERIGLSPRLMNEEQYRSSMDVIDACDQYNYVGFLRDAEKLVRKMNGGRTGTHAATRKK